MQESNSSPAAANASLHPRYAKLIQLRTTRAGTNDHVVAAGVNCSIVYSRCDLTKRQLVDKFAETQGKCEFTIVKRCKKLIRTEGADRSILVG